jgi:ribosomal protein S3
MQLDEREIQILELCDGSHSVDQIAIQIAETINKKINFAIAYYQVIKLCKHLYEKGILVKVS